MVFRLLRSLDAWRSEQRRLDKMPEDALGRGEFEDPVEQLRWEYQALYNEGYGEPRPRPHGDRPER